MNSDTTRIFDSTLNSSKFPFLDEYNFKTPYFIGTILIGFYLIICKVTFLENPLIYVVFAIVGFYSLIFILIKLFTKKVIKIKFDLNTITFTYLYKTTISEHTTKINSTSVQLLELRNHKSYFEGIEINFKDIIDNKSFKLMGQNWSYIDMENIYIEFKKRKNEEIAKDENSTFKQLQLINNSTNKNIA